MNDKDGPYEINEKDIDAILRILRVQNPNAQREEAIEMLETLKSSFHNLQQVTPVKLNEIYQRMMKDKDINRN